MEPVGQMRNGDNNTFQSDAVDLIVQNRGGYVSGQGGTGKSTCIKGLVRAFEDAGYMHTDKKGEVHSRVFCLGFTHVAAQNRSRTHDFALLTSTREQQTHCGHRRCSGVSPRELLDVPSCTQVDREYRGGSRRLRGPVDEHRRPAQGRRSPQGVSAQPLRARSLQRPLHRAEYIQTRL